MLLLNEAIRTAEQLPQREMRTPLVKGILITAAVLLIPALVLGVLAGMFSSLLSWFGVGDGSFGTWDVLGYLFIPAAAFAVAFFADPVADVVEARHFRQAGEARARPLKVDLTLATKFMGLALLINIPLLPFYWVFPPLPAAINGYLLGREYFELVARRRDTAPRTAELRKAVRGSMWLAGAALAFLATIPVVNLVVPVFGMGLMTHIYHRARGS